MSDPRITGTEQLRKELHAVIRRYSDEGDMSVYELIGTLRVVELDIIEILEKSNKRQDTENESDT